MSSPYDIGETTVWVKDANAETGAFEWTMPWRVEKRLIPTRSLMGLSANGDASFRLLRRYRNDDVRDVYDVGAAVGSYVAITPNTDPPNDTDPATTENALWFGVITGREYTCLSVDDANQTQPDEVGTVTARGLGDLLDRVMVSGFRQEASDASPLGDVLRTAPQANITFALGHVVGNRTDVTLDGATMALFTRLPASMTQVDGSPSGFWTRKALLNHLIRFCKPDGVPPMTLNALTAAVLTDLDADERVTFDLSGVTFRGALDLLIPRSRGLVWSLWPRATSWAIFVDSLATTTTTYLHANATRTIDAKDCDLEAVDLSEEIVYDQVVCRGAPHVFCFSWGIADGNAEKGWGSTQETAYRAGASKHADGTTNSTYSSLTNPQKLQANREVRQAVYGDVFSRILLKASATGSVKHRGASSGTGGGSDSNAFPHVTWNGSATTVSSDNLDTSDETPYLPLARVMRTIPWQEGRASGGANTSDLRAVEAKLRPRYMTPRVFRYISGDTYKWTDLLAAGDSQPGPQVDVDDRSPALRVTYTPAELLAKGSWGTSSPVPTTPYSVDPDSDGTASDYRKLVFTTAMEADQRLEVSQLRSGVTAAGVRRPLILEDNKLQFWYVHAGTILGIRGDRTPDRLTAAVKVRDDYLSAQAWLEQTAAFALTTRTPATITLAHPDAKHVWAEVGELIDQVIERAPGSGDQTGRELYRRTLNSTVESVERIYAAEDGGAPRTVVRTMVADPPARFGLNVSPTGGGPTSQALGGSLPQAAMAAQAKSARNEREAQRLPVIPPKPALGSSSIYTLEIDRGNTLSDGSTLGIKWASPAPTTVPSLYDPTVTSSFVDGIGRATLRINGVSQGFVLVAHYTGNGSPLTLALFSGQVVLTSAATVTLPLSGDPTQTVTLYVPQTP